MHELYEIKEQLMDELKEYRNKQKKSVDDIMVMKYLTSAIDHLCNIIEKAEEEEYSNRGGQGGNSRNSYDGSYRYSREGRGNSYARGRSNYSRRDSMGRYSRDGGYSREGGYSRADGVEELAESVREMMQDLPQNLQQEAQKFVQKLESM